MGSQQSKKKRSNKRRHSKLSGNSPSQAQDTKPVGSGVVCDHAEERELLEEVYTQVFTLMCRKADLKRQLADLEQRVHVLQQGVVAAQTREDEAKVRLLEGRRAERRYRELLVGVADVADEYRLSVTQAAETDEPSPDESSTSEQNANRLRRMVQAPLERIEDLLSSQGISAQHAESDREIDVRFFDVAGVIDNAEREPGTVVRGHRPAYVGHDGTVIRKGAAIVTRRGEPLPTDPESDLA